MVVVAFVGLGFESDTGAHPCLEAFSKEIPKKILFLVEFALENLFHLDLTNTDIWLTVPGPDSITVV